MISKMDPNGDTASLKRKREPPDDAPLSQKKHRRRAKSQLQNAISEEVNSGTGDRMAHHTASEHVNGDLELMDASLETAAGAIHQAKPSWKLSKPMGGRMLDIDPIFSLDERCVMRKRWENTEPVEFCF